MVVGEDEYRNKKNEYSSEIYLYFLQGKKGTLEITRKYAN